MSVNSHKLRVIVLSVAFFGLLLLLLSRLFWLTVVKREFLEDQGKARSVRVIDIPAYRGMVTDRKGQPLAVSTPVQSVWINPIQFQADDVHMQRIATTLKIPYAKLSQRVTNGKERGFLYLKRHVLPMTAEKLKQLKIPGLHFQQEFKRYYPESYSTAHLIGFTNIDDKGQEGIELSYQHWLQGQSGKKKVVKDRKGHIIAESERIDDPKAGHDLTLSIDRRIQYIAYHELSKAVQEKGAKGGSIVVLDSQSGELLAVANAPSFNPNNRSFYDPERYRNRAFVDRFEPGSIIKPFSIAAALESGKFHRDSTIDTRPSWMMVEGHPIRDVGNYGVLSVQGVLEHSSNVGITKLVLANPPLQLLQIFKDAGFGQRTESGFPGETEGSLQYNEDINKFVLATMGFGYGLSTSAVQIAKAYTIFANKGRLVPIALVYSDTQTDQPQVISEETAEQVLAMMESVVEQGTGKRARISGYRIAGKTGTTRVADKNGYDAERHIASFVGIGPVSQPRLIVVVVVYEPVKGSYYGSIAAAPLAAKVMHNALRIKNIPPDKPLKKR